MTFGALISAATPAAANGSSTSTAAQSSDRCRGRRAAGRADYATRLPTKTFPLLALAALLFAIGSVTVPRAADAALAYAVAGTTNMRSGPGTRYPVIARVVGGTRVNVIGCLPDRAWCDVSVGAIRGWISSRRLEFLYSGRRVLVPGYYRYFGAPIVQFHFGRPWHWRPHGHRPHEDHERPRD